MIMNINTLLRLVQHDCNRSARVITNLQIADEERKSAALAAQAIRVAFSRVKRRELNECAAA
jgi:hypothetical protein